jgi:hypothetical protein
MWLALHVGAPASPYWQDCCSISEELRRQAIELIILFLADADLASFEALKNLKSGFPTLIFVPVINEATTRAASAAADSRERLLAQFRYNIRVPALDPVLSLLIGGPNFSFAQFMRHYPGERALPGQAALYAWIRAGPWCQPEEGLESSSQ